MTYQKQGKRFISDDDSEFGSVCWYVRSESYGKDQCNANQRRKDASVRITDCYKVVSLEFDYYSYDQYQQRLDKIDSLISELQDFRIAMVESWGKS